MRGHRNHAGAVRRASVSALRVGVLLACAIVGGYSTAYGQVYLRDLVFTGGFSVERYNGNFSAVTVPVVDSTDHAQAAVGQFAGRGEVRLLEAFRSGVQQTFVSLRFDAGVRQFAATGYELRDYAPRELVGRVDLAWWRRLGNASALTLSGTLRGRAVEDRPPTPLFLQPGYGTARGAALFEARVTESVVLDLEADVDGTDYEAVALLSELDLLDRNSVGVEVGATVRGEGGVEGLSGVPSTWMLRIHGGLRRIEYPNQDSFDPADPFRRDRMATLGILWERQGSVFTELGVVGAANRSNSQRPEYDAVSVRAGFGSLLPFWDLGVNVLAVVTAKSYLQETPFARLVPGEEADNASLVYLDLSRPLASNLDGTLRFGWTRAETDIGESYYSRFGVSALLYYRPIAR